VPAALIPVAAATAATAGSNSRQQQQSATTTICLDKLHDSAAAVQGKKGVVWDRVLLLMVVGIADKIQLGCSCPSRDGPTGAVARRCHDTAPSTGAPSQVKGTAVNCSPNGHAADAA
jgi:hypothetical protein